MLVTIEIYQTLADAQVAASNLESNGIQCHIADNFMSTYNPIAVGGVRLQVAQSDVEEALNILKTTE